MVYPNSYLYLSSLNGCISYRADFDSDHPMLIKNSECFRNLFQTLASTLPVPKPSFIQEHIHFSTLPIPKPSFIQEHIHFPVSTKEVATFTDTPPNILAQPAMLMDALKGYQLNSVPTRGHAKAQAKAVGMDLCGAPVTAVCTVPCLKINSKLQSLLLPVIQSKCLVLALTYASSASSTSRAVSSL